MAITTETPLGQELEEFRREVEKMKSDNPSTQAHIEGLIEKSTEMASKANHLDYERQMYKDMASSLKGDVKVLCRVRPDPDPLVELSGSSKNLRVVSTKELEVWTNRGAQFKRRRSFSVRTSKSVSAIDDNWDRRGDPGDPKMFYFDHCLGPEATDEEVFDCVHVDVMASIRGHQVCIMAYGATGAGKTHTIESISYRASAMIEEECNNAKAKNERLQVKVQMVEVYNEQFRDLLAPSTPSSSLKLTASPHDPSSVVLQGTVRWPIQEDRVQDGLLDVFQIAKANRATAVTNIHERSSRSHLVVSIMFSYWSATGSLLSSGKLSLVDLAGSERLKNSEASGQRMKEAQHINKSLAALGDVVWAQARKTMHVPYRNSKLTHLLQDSLGGQMSRTVLIIASSPNLQTMPETLHSINFGSRLNNVNFNDSARLADSVEHTRLRSLVEQRSLNQGRLEEQVSSMREEADALRTKQEIDAEERDRISSNHRSLAKSLKQKEEELINTLCRMQPMEERINKKKTELREKDDQIQKQKKDNLKLREENQTLRLRIKEYEMRLKRESEIHNGTTPGTARQSSKRAHENNNVVVPTAAACSTRNDERDRSSSCTGAAAAAAAVSSLNSTRGGGGDACSVPSVPSRSARARSANAVVVRNGGYVCGANGGNGRNGNGHANGNSSTERKGELESHTIFQPISNESTQSSSRSVEKELPQTSRFSWEGANHARGLHDITKPSTSRGEHRPLMTGAGVLESHDSSSLRETSSSEIPRGNTETQSQPQPQQHPSSQFGHNNVRSGMGIGVNGGGGGGGGGSAIIAPSAGNTTAARVSNGNNGPGTRVNANGNTVGSSTTHGLNTTSFEGVEAVPTTARQPFEQQLLPNQALRYVHPQKATPPKISTPTMPCHGHPGSMNHHLHHHHLNGVQAAAGVMEGINGGNSLMNTTTTRQSSCSQQDYYNAPCTAVAQGPPLSYTQGPPPYFSVNPPKFPMNNQAQQESADSRWSNGNGALSVPTSYTQKNPFNNRARSNEVPHGNRITFDPERNGAAAAASVASAAAAPHHGAGVNGKGIVSGRIVFDPDILSQTFPQTPKGSSVDTDPLDAMQRMKTKMGVEDPLNCTATPSRNATVPSPTQPGPLAEEGQHHPQQNHTNEEEAHQRKLLNDRKQQQQQQQQAALKKARREIERKTFYVDTITSNEAMNRITNMQHLPGHINYGPNMNGLLQNMTSCSSPQDGGHGATASATANGGGRNTPGGNRHAPTRGNHHSPASVSGNSHARHGGAGSSPTTQGQQHQHQHPPQTRQQTARYAQQQQQGPQRRRSHSANNINSSSRNGTNEGNDDSPLLFIHRRIEQRLPSGFVDGDGGDAYDDIHGLEEVLSCSQISTSSNGSEIKKRLRHALIGSAGTGAGGHGGGPKNTGKKNAGGGPPSNNTQAVNGGHGNGNGAHPRNGGGGHGNGNAHNGGDGMTPPPGLNEQQQQQQQQQQGTTVSNTPWPLFPSLGAPLNTTLFSPHIPPAPRFMSPHTTTIPPPRFSPSVHRPLF